VRDTTQLRQAVAAFREATKSSPRKRNPRDWARFQTNLGNALTSIAARTLDKKLYREGIALLNEALAEINRKLDPEQWLVTQMFLGSALALPLLNEQKKLEQAVNIFSEVLKETSRERVPFVWATIQNALASALLKLSDGSWDEPDHLDEAIAAYREVEKEFTRERMPLAWGHTKANLADAFKRLGQRENDPSQFELSIAAYKDALLEITKERAPAEWSAIQFNIAELLLVTADGQTGEIEAVVAMRNALKDFSRKDRPWGLLNRKLGIALEKLGDSSGDIKAFKEAITAYQEALPFFVSIGLEGSSLFGGVRDRIKYCNERIRQISAGQFH
jgi:tetratricopeptide (TPR) repeat protein